MTAAFPGNHEAELRLLRESRPRLGVPARLLRLASDERLVEHVRAGSEAAFEALFDRHHRGVLAFCRHMLGSVEEAEDAVQHTFLAAYRELVGSDKHVLLRPWLYTIARNRCLTVLRGRIRQDGGELVEPPTEHLSASVERRHDLRSLLRDLAGLPEDQRAALVLSELGDMAHDEIADVLGCRRDKVKALVFQARSSLIASRAARETSCQEIREQLANLRGGALRRNELRRHVNECAGCREFRDQVRAQRRDLALVLPVAPTVGLKSAVVGAAVGGSAAGSAAVGGTTLAAKVLVAAAIAGGGTVAIRAETSGGDRARPESSAVGSGLTRAVAAPEHAANAAPGRGAAPAPPAEANSRSARGDARGDARGHAKGKARGDAKGHTRGHEKTAPPAHAKSAPGHDKHAGHGKPEDRVKATPPGQARSAPPANAKGPLPDHVKAATPPGSASRDQAATPSKPVKAPPDASLNAVVPLEAAEPGKAPEAAEPAVPAVPGEAPAEPATAAK